MANLSKDEKLHAYKHTGFWQCMDTVRDKDYLDKIKCVISVFYHGKILFFK